MLRRKIIVFDWDGTLADSGPAVLGAMQRLVQEYRYRTLTKEEILQHLGLSIKDFARKILRLNEAQIPLYLTRFYHLFELEEQKQDILYEDALEVLNYFKQQQYSLVIATNRIRRRLDAALKLTHLENFFDYTVTADEALDKPNPLMLEKIMTALQCKKEDLLMVGDSVYDADFAENGAISCIIIDRHVYDPALFTKYANLQLLPNLKAMLNVVQ